MSNYMDEKSDRAIVPKKTPNKESLFPEEVSEGRARPKGNHQQVTGVRTLRRGAASIGLLKVRLAARRDKRVRFSALLHHITVDILEKSYYAIRRESSSGIDGMNWRTYGEKLIPRLRELHEMIHKGSYRSKPARRAYIPKSDGSQRPLSIWCVEDKIVQQAVVFVLNAIYEEDFLGFSYGFRPHIGQHDALDALSVALYRKRVNWVLDTDIEKFFDHMDHEWLMEFLEYRVGDKRILRLIKKWLKVGIRENGCIIRNERGTPQGAVISPVLANIYLHYVYDLWVNAWRKEKARGDVIVIRYADDTVSGFQYRDDAEMFVRKLKERLKYFGLSLHPSKTRLIRFGRYAIEQCKKKGIGKPMTFDFLGFTHYCTRSHKNGWFVVGRKTIKKRMRSHLKEIKRDLQRRINRPVNETGRWLRQVLTGHLNYYAVPGNGKSISTFFYLVSWYWMRMLRRRSQRNRMTWERFSRIQDNFFPPIRTVHPHTLHRFDAKTRGRSPVR